MLARCKISYSANEVVKKFDREKWEALRKAVWGLRLPEWPEGNNAIDNDCIKLRNNTEYGSSLYLPSRFKLAGKYNKNPGAYNEFNIPDEIPFTQEKTMLHIAIRIGASGGMDTFDLIAAQITAIGRGTTTLSLVDSVMADTSAEGLKGRIRSRISVHSDEKWLILSGNTIGEIAEPPVRFRSI